MRKSRDHGATRVYDCKEFGSESNSGRALLYELLRTRNILESNSDMDVISQQTWKILYIRKHSGKCLSTVVDVDGLVSACKIVLSCRHVLFSLKWMTTNTVRMSIIFIFPRMQVQNDTAFASLRQRNTSRGIQKKTGGLSPSLKSNDPKR